MIRAKVVFNVLVSDLLSGLILLIFIYVQILILAKIGLPTWFYEPGYLKSLTGNFQFFSIWLILPLLPLVFDFLIVLFSFSLFDSILNNLSFVDIFIISSVPSIVISGFNFFPYIFYKEGEIDNVGFNGKRLYWNSLKKTFISEAIRLFLYLFDGLAYFYLFKILKIFPSHSSYI